MDTKPLEKFAQTARRQLQAQVKAKLEQVLRTDSAELRAKANVVADLNKQIARSSRAVVIEQVAYTWFNRFCALRYMDANRYTRISVVSPAPGNTQPEILQEAKQGHIDADLRPFVDSQRVFDLLAGRLTSPDSQGEAYRLLLVGSCNQYHEVMPFLFEKIDDYTELLMPDDLLSAGSVLAAARAALTEAACADVEVIGWLYQFYISEKKDAVIGAKKKITPENIPAATQLFTPDWIVRYLVQNSLGRLWLLNRPSSRLAEKMEFYISDRSVEKDGSQITDNGSPITDHRSPITDHRSPITDHRSPITDYLKISSLEELTVCDPAVGSGHMLTYAFDLLYEIYAEEGYNEREIPQLILQNNLVGLEIDERAGALAAFALMMKATSKDRRFLRRAVHPAITVLRPITFTEEELDKEVNHLLDLSFPNTAQNVIPNPRRGEESFPSSSAKDSSEEPRNDNEGQQLPLLTGSDRRRALEHGLRHDLTLFREADNFGSLLRPQLSAAQLRRLQAQVASQSAPAADLFSHDRRQRVGRALQQAELLARPHHAVIANPPYMGSGNQNDKLKKFLNDGYKDVKADLFSAFMVRIMDMTYRGGFIGMMTPFNWMFLNSFEKMRQLILDNYTLTNLVRPEFHAFFDSAFVTICGFTLFADSLPEYKGAFIDLDNFYGADVQPTKALEAIQNPNCDWLYYATANDFKKIDSYPIAYWASEKIRNAFERGMPFSTIAEPRKGITTSDNEKYLRSWYEVAVRDIEFNAHATNGFVDSLQKWFPVNKGGNYRKWYGNKEIVIEWSNNGYSLKNFDRAVLRNSTYYFREGMTWNDISSGNFNMRYSSGDSMFEGKGPMAFARNRTELKSLLAFFNSKVVSAMLSFLSPTLNFNIGEISKVPVISEILEDEFIARITQKPVSLAKDDWDSYEISWDFSSLPLLQKRQSQDALAPTYANLRQQWQAMTLAMQRLEEENNRLFIEAYGLEDELTADVPLAEITLTCNPHYRYGGPLTVAGDRLSLIRERWPEVTANWPAGEEGLELRLLADTMREFISYAVGCMFGRYSLDKPGLILANQGETLEDYIRKVTTNATPHVIPSERSDEESFDSASAKDSSHSFGMTSKDDITFMPDADNAIPMLDGDWFNDDISQRFKSFLRLTFGDDHYEENLAFVEAAIGRDIRSYFLRDFYTHHLKMYKKRPIYWLFSSAKGSFNVLIYMHRYRPDTVSVILNDYLREFRTKLNARKSYLEGVSNNPTAASRDRTQALKEVSNIDKTLKEIREYEDDVLYPLATHQVTIDLDDGVKVNYNKFGPALKKVAGLSK